MYLNHLSPPSPVPTPPEVKSLGGGGVEKKGKRVGVGKFGGQKLGWEKKFLLFPFSTPLPHPPRKRPWGVEGRGGEGGGGGGLVFGLDWEKKFYILHFEELTNPV